MSTSIESVLVETGLNPVPHRIPGIDFRKQLPGGPGNGLQIIEERADPGFPRRHAIGLFEKSRDAVNAALHLRSHLG